MEDKFELGPIQKEWLKSLREHPERQMSGQLGEGIPESYNACCLGEWCVVYNRMMGLPDPFRNGQIYSGGSLGWLKEPHNDCFNREYGGTSALIEGSLKTYKSLGHMNDSGVTWPEIADFVEANPEAVFIKSI